MYVYIYMCTLYIVTYSGVNSEYDNILFYEIKLVPSLYYDVHHEPLYYDVTNPSTMTSLIPPL